MKKKISITIEEEKVKQLDSKLETGKFRNRSHAVEYAVGQFLEEENAEER